MRLLRRRSSTPAVSVVSADTPPVPPLPSRHNYPHFPDRPHVSLTSPRTPRARQSSLRTGEEQDHHQSPLPGCSTPIPLARSPRRQYTTFPGEDETTSGLAPGPRYRRRSSAHIKAVSWADAESLDSIVTGLGVADGGARRRQTAEGPEATLPHDHVDERNVASPGCRSTLQSPSPTLSVSPASVEEDNPSRALLSVEALSSSSAGQSRHARKLTKRRPKSTAPPVSFARHQRLPDAEAASLSPVESRDSVNPYAILRPLDQAIDPALSARARSDPSHPAKGELGRQNSLSAASAGSCNQTDESPALKTPEGAVYHGEEAQWSPAVQTVASRAGDGDTTHSTPSPRLVEGRKTMHRPPSIRRRSSSLDQSATQFDSIYSIGEIHTASRLEAIPASTIQLRGSGMSIKAAHSGPALSGHDASSELPYLDGQKTRLRTYSTRPAPPPPHLHIEIPGQNTRAELLRPHESLPHPSSAISTEALSESTPRVDDFTLASGQPSADTEHSPPTAIPRRGSSLPTTGYMPLGPFTPPLDRPRYMVTSSSKASVSPSETSTDNHAAETNLIDPYEVRRAHRQSLVDIADDRVFHQTLTALLTSSEDHRRPVATLSPDRSEAPRPPSTSPVTPVQRPLSRSPRTPTDANVRERGIAAWFVTREIVQGERKYGRSLAKGLELIQLAIEETQDSVPPLPDIPLAAATVKRASAGFRSTPSSPRRSSRRLARPKSVHAANQPSTTSPIEGGRELWSSPHPFVTLQRHLPDLLALSVKLSDTFEHDPSPYAVSDAFVSLEADITRELARWAGILGNVFAMGMGQSLKVGNERSWRSSSYGDVAGLAAEERLGLTDIIIMPIQRAARYKLLFKELRTKTPAESNTRRKVDAALRAAERLASECNARQTFDLNVLRRGYQKPSGSKRNKRRPQSAGAPAVESWDPFSPF